MSSLTANKRTVISFHMDVFEKPSMDDEGLFFVV
jgi:hypothetical protein